MSKRRILAPELRCSLFARVFYHFEHHNFWQHCGLWIVFADWSNFCVTSLFVAISQRSVAFDFWAHWRGRPSICGVGLLWPQRLAAQDLQVGRWRNSSRGAVTNLGSQAFWDGLFCHRICGLEQPKKMSDIKSDDRDNSCWTSFAQKCGVQNVPWQHPNGHHRVAGPVPVLWLCGILAPEGVVVWLLIHWQLSTVQSVAASAFPLDSGGVYWYCRCSVYRLPYGQYWRVLFALYLTVYILCSTAHCTVSGLVVSDSCSSVSFLAPVKLPSSIQ